MKWVEIPGNEIINLDFIKSIALMQKNEAIGEHSPYIAFRSITLQFFKQFETYEEAREYYEELLIELKAYQYEPWGCD